MGRPPVGFDPVDRDPPGFGAPGRPAPDPLLPLAEERPEEPARGDEPRDELSPVRPPAREPRPLPAPGPPERLGLPDPEPEGRPLGRGDCAERSAIGFSLRRSPTLLLRALRPS